MNITNIQTPYTDQKNICLARLHTGALIVSIKIKHVLTNQVTF